MLGMLYMKYKSIILVIVAHAAFNITNVILSTWVPEANILILFTLGLVVSAVCAVSLIKRPGAYSIVG